MGVVYLAESSKRRRVALKVIKEELAHDKNFRARFTHEVSAAKRVDGVFTASVLDSDVTSVPTYMATEYINGPTLDEFVSSVGPLRGKALSGFAVALAEALSAIHRVGLIHRDLKPSNILLSVEGPKVIDFGIARAAEGTSLTGTGMTVGTPAWMAPEQARGGRVDEKADIFSWGSIVTYAATGTSPFGEGPSDALLYRIVHEEPSLTGVDDALKAPVAQALSKDPASRPTARQLMSTMLDDPDATQTAEGAKTTASQYLAKTWNLDAAETAVKQGRPILRRVLVALLAVALLSGAAVAAWLFYPWAGSNQNLKTATTEEASPVPSQQPEPSAEPAPDARDVPIRRLLARGTEATKVLYAELDGSAPEEIVVRSSTNEDDPFAPEYVDVFAWNSERWRRQLNFADYVSPGFGEPLLDPELSGVEIKFLDAIDFFDDGSEELVVGAHYFGGSSGPMAVSILGVTGRHFEERFFTKTENAGKLRADGNTVVLTAGSYTPADPNCCPSFMSTERIAAQGGKIRVVSREEDPVDTGDSLTSESRLRLDGIAGITVGMTLNEASEAAGVPIEITMDTGRGCSYAEPIGGPKGLSIMVERGRITRFDVHGGLIRTLSGIEVGSSKSLVYETYPGRIEETKNIYGETILEYIPEEDSDLLMAFYVDRSGVYLISSGRARSVRYAEGCF